MGWRVLYIEESDKLSLYLDNIKVTKNDEEYLILISDVHTIILDNYKINISVHLINALTKANVNIILCGIDHLPQSIIIPHHGNKLAFKMLNKQLSWNNNKKIKTKIHQHIIKNKIKNQNKLLKFLKKESKTIAILDRYYEEVDLDDKTNREGLSAKLYFVEMFGKHFIRFNDDVINAGLNYGYAILRSQISKVLVAKGFNTSIGIFHKNRENEFNLSDDIIEPYRPIIDFHVYSNLRDQKLFLKEHRLNLVKATIANVSIDNKRQTLFNSIKIFVEGIINYCKSKDDKDLKEININYEKL